jgi:hypothetical protein
MMSPRRDTGLRREGSRFLNDLASGFRRKEKIGIYQSFPKYKYVRDPALGSAEAV